MSGQIVSSFQPVNRPTHQPTLVEERMPEPNDASEVINPIDHTIYDYSSTPSLSPQNAYLDYAPKPTRNIYCYQSCFERLGFIISDGTVGIREQFQTDMRAHVDGSDYKYLLRRYNERAFSNLLSEFLVTFGPTYWGQSERRHLDEPDIQKGFLYPRDASRDNSSFVEALVFIFEYKARAAVNTKERFHGQAWISKVLDFSAMTGRQADATTTVINQPASSKEGTSEEETSGTEDDKPYNFLDVEETPTILRPLANVNRIRHYSHNDQEVDGAVATSALKNKRKRTRRHSPKDQKVGRAKATDPPENKSKRQRHRVSAPAGNCRVSHPTRSHTGESSSDSDVPLTARLATRKRCLTFSDAPVSNSPAQKRKLHRGKASNITTQTTSPFANPNARSLARRTLNAQRPTPSANHAERMSPIVDLIALSSEPSRAQGEGVHTKNELLDPGLMARTIFRVSASNHPNRGPIHVPFISCSTPSKLFSELISERQIAPELAKKVTSLTATCSGESFGIRKDRPQDWVFFCEHLREVWEEKMDKKEKCKVDIMIHVDD